MKAPKIIFGFLVFMTSQLVFAAGAGNSIPVPKTVDRKLIIEFPKKPNEYLSGADAIRICEQYRGLKVDPSPTDPADPEQDSYFFVFCKLNWDEKEKEIYGFEKVPVWIELGTETKTTDSYWGHFETSSPILKKTLVPSRSLVDIKNVRLLSVAVWGVGNVKNLPWKVLYPSTNVGGGDYPLLFDKFSDAKRHCERIRLQRSLKPENVLRYDRARCKITEHPEGGYYFQIRTKNPLI